MWYQATGGDGLGALSIGLATSTNGLTWTKYGSNPVIFCEAALGEPTTPGAMAPAVYHNNDSGGMFYILYTCGTGGDGSIYIAKTADTHNYYKYTDNPIFIPTADGWDGGNVGCGDFLYDNGNYYLFYVGVSVANQVTYAGANLGLTTNPLIPQVTLGVAQRIYESTMVGCVARYDMEESIGPIVNRITPGTHDLLNFGGVQGVATSHAKFYGFNGTSAYMEMNDTYTLTDDFSVEVICSISASTGADQLIFGDMSGGTGWALYYDDSATKFWFVSKLGGAPLITISSLANVTFGKVNHILITHDADGGANNTKIYINGTLNNSATNASPPGGHGVYGIGAGEYLKGRVFLCCIYNRVLSDTEDAQNFESERWRIPHTRHTWAAAPSAAAVHTYARITNLEKQWEHLACDIGPIQATQIVATTTSLKKAGADFICDGTADDVQIQAAVDAAHAVGGGTVMILDGTYVLAASIKLYDNITLCGMGRATKLKRYGGVGYYAIENYDGNEGNAGITIRDLTIVGNGGTSLANTCEKGIFFTNCIEVPYISIQKVHFSDNVYEGIELTECQHVVVDGCSNVGRQASGAGSFLLYGDNSKFLQIANCSALEYSGIYLYQCSDSMIKGCVVTTNAVAAYNFFECTHCGVIGCSSAPDSVGSPFMGILDSTGLQNLFTNNVIYKGTAGGIDMDSDSVGNVVIGNVIRDTEGYGILYGDSLGYANLSFNNISNASKDGIRAPYVSAATISGGVINSNNIFYCARNGIVLSAVARSVCNYNVCFQNTHTDNTGSNIAIYDEASGYYSSENLVSQNLCHKGDTAPRPSQGIWIGTGSTNNMVTMNYLKDSGQTAALTNSGTTTDLKTWMTAGNKIA
jgi:hypothetical protein